MAVEAIAVTLLAKREDRANIAHDQFVSRLASDPLKESFSTRSGAGVGKSSAVNLQPILIEEFAADEEERYESFAQRLELLWDNVTLWLNGQSQSVFEGMRGSGLTIWLFVHLVLSDDQIELHLPPHLLSACARLDLEIDVNSF